MVDIVSSPAHELRVFLQYDIEELRLPSAAYIYTDDDALVVTSSTTTLPQECGATSRPPKLVDPFFAGAAEVRDGVQFRSLFRNYHRVGCDGRIAS